LTHTTQYRENSKKEKPYRELNMVLPPILAFSMFSLAKTGILGGTTKYVDIGVINDHCRGILRRYIF
jgi:hypothetical protein